MFELRRDHTWVEFLELKFKENGVHASEMSGFREAWNQNAEKTDWAWWQKEANLCSDVELDDMRMDCIDQLNALGFMQRNRDMHASAKDKFQKVLTGTLNNEEKPRGHSRDHNREM